MSGFTQILAKLADRQSLSAPDAETAFQTIMNGEADTAQIAAFLTALRVRGETVEEITAGAKVMRAHAEPIKAPENAVDTCGTGGSGLHTYNVSTASAFILAAAGIPVVKHGNRAATSRSGTADALEALGGKIDLPMSTVQASLDELGFTFLFARSHHQAMKHVAPVRSSLKFKTIFNLLGPLSSPAQAKRQVLGVFDRKWLHPMAKVLQELGSTHVMLVHGHDGMDEITTSGITEIVELNKGDIREYEITPEDAGLKAVPLEALLGGNPEHNAKAIVDLFDGSTSPFRDIVLMNAAAAFIVADKATDLKEGVQMAADMVDSGAAKAKLQQWIEFTNR